MLSNKAAHLSRQNKSHTDMKMLFSQQNDNTIDNFQAIYDKVEQASSLLRSRSAERKNSAIRQYESGLKGQKMIQTQKLQSPQLLKVN